MKVGQHVQNVQGTTGHITEVRSGIVEVQWDDEPWGVRSWHDENFLVHDYPADARSAAHFEEHRQAYNDASAAGRYQGD